MDVFDQNSMLLNAAKKISLEEYLRTRGLFPAQRGFGKVWYFSPFKEEKTPSFCLYEETNKFVDYSSGIKGDIIDFIVEHDMMSFEEAIRSIFKGTLLPINNKIKKKKKDYSEYKNFPYKKYLATEKEDLEKIYNYAESRGITEHYVPALLHCVEEDALREKLSLGFIHRDEDLDICGIKFRFIDPLGNQRFSSRGRLCFYILTSKYPEKAEYVFITESETSSNSLHKILLEQKGFEFVILCIGGSWNHPEILPREYQNIPNKFIILDYDGGSPEYDKKILALSKFGKEIRMPYEKGEDINYLLLNGRKDEIIYHLTENGVVFA